MLRYLKNRFHWKSISFQIPDGFYLDSEPGEERDNFLRLWPADMAYSLWIYIAEDCGSTRMELGDVLEDMVPQWAAPIEPISINGLDGHHTVYHMSRQRYYEVWLKIGDGAALNIIMENEDDPFEVDTMAVMAAIDPRRES